MPLYEYQCKKCGHRFEKIQKFSDKMIKKCPDCGGAVEQVISAPAVQFKGSGWYVTDYARKSHTPSTPEAGDKGSKESKKEEKAKSEGSSKETPKESKDATSKKADKHK